MIVMNIITINTYLSQYVDVLQLLNNRKKYQNDISVVILTKIIVNVFNFHKCINWFIYSYIYIYNMS